MDTGRDVQPEYQATIKSWERKVPWYRRISARTGLQGKLVLSFTFMLLIALGSSCWLFVNDSSNVIRNLMGEQAKEISRTLAMASETPLKAGDTRELNRIGRDLLKNRDVVAVAFWGPSGSVMAVACQDPDLVDWKNGGFLRNPRASSTEQLQTAHHGWVKALGSYVEVASPVLSYQAVVPTGAAGARREGPRLLGYVTVCLSQADNEQRVLQIELSLVLIGAVSILCSVPLVYLLVHRIFHPIRALVAATDRIAAGDLDAEVAIHRPDVIGTLARSFNEMVKRVRHQQGDLEAANDKLADANRQLADANRDLEQKVFQRTAQLAAANKRLESEIAEKEDFLRAVSHDLNAPLRNISGMAAMLLMKHRERFDEDIIHRLERIQKNVEVETDLISELLELSRIKTRRQKMEPVDVRALVEEIGGTLEEDLRSRQIRLVVDGELPVLECERARIRQVFQNLIDNAIKYMGDGSDLTGSGTRVKEIRVGCRVRPEEAEFYVRDTGIGIEPEDIDKVFFVFRRGKSQAVQNVAGKGVGLASVKSIVETYNGSIWVESQVRRGSTFRFTINGKYVPQSRDASDAYAAGAAQREPRELSVAGMGT